MTLPKTIFYQAQEAVVSMLSGDAVLSGRVPFVAENLLDIDYLIKNALGKQGIVGIVMTPQAFYQGVNAAGEQVWNLEDFTVQVAENPIVNRTLSASRDPMTAFDAVTRVTEVLGSPLSPLWGQYCPKTIEQGEDSGLLVAQTKFDCQVRADRSPYFPSKQGIKMSDGTVIPVGDSFFSPTGYNVNTTLTTLGYTTADVAEIYVFSKLNTTGDYSANLKAAYIDSSCPAIGRDLWSRPFAGSLLEKVVFRGRTYADVEAMDYYPWGLEDTSKIVAEPNPKTTLLPEPEPIPDNYEPNDAI